MTYEEQKEEAWGLCGHLSRRAARLLACGAMDIGYYMDELAEAVCKYDKAIFALADRKREEEDGG